MSIDREAPTPVRETVQDGLALHQAGRLSEAERVYRQVLLAEPENAEALHLLGVVAHQGGKHELAAGLIEKALCIQPSNAQFLNNLGEAKRALSRFQDALACYDRALALGADFPEALSNRATALMQLERFAEALPDCDRALALRPDSPEALNNRGVALGALKRFDEALAAYDRLVGLKPGWVEAWCNRGNVLQQLKRYDEAVKSYDRALALRPGDPNALNNRGNALQGLGRYEEALRDYDRALAFFPDDVRLHNNRGNALQHLNRYEEAIESYDRALALKPDYVKALGNRGVGAQHLRRYQEALGFFDRALAHAPENAEVHWNRSLCQLLLGDFEDGWRRYEWRWRWDGFPSLRRDFAQPLWLGREDLAGKTILLHAEQGLGDTIQFVRYVDLVASRGAQVTLEVQPELKSLLASSLPRCRIVARAETLPPFDFHCPLLSLPLAFGTRLETIPARVPYLAPDAPRVARWQEKLGPRRRRRVGVAWAGSGARNNADKRPVPLGRLAELSVGGVQLVSLQKELQPGEDAILADRGIAHFGSELRDFSDTAALISLMDLVVTVDTAVAHLAGAMARPLWILLSYGPDWRWMADRSDNPWYPTARLFRQHASGNWDGVMQQVSDVLAAEGR